MAGRWRDVCRVARPAGHDLSRNAKTKETIMIEMTKGDTALIVAECKKQGLMRNQCAYVLATAYWETARTMKPVREYGGETYLRAKKYYPYVGMGYVQLTWLDNYKRASRELGVDFVAAPKLLLKPEHAVKILVIGMIEGWFTGKRLSDYITLQKSDFADARRIINGVDRRHEIAAIAQDYDQALIEDGYGVAVPKPRSRPMADEAPPPISAPPGKHQTFWTRLAALIGRLFHRS